MQKKCKHDAAKNPANGLLSIGLLASCQDMWHTNNSKLQTHFAPLLICNFGMV